ncbi:MAG: hypothetical protein J0M02_18145 [Planctomycetes bacterium]|nr:hypothetical protein [Planctomycetota bacterium]
MPERIISRAWDCAALGRRWPYALRLPEGAPPPGGWPLLIILHGAGRSHRTLAEHGADLPFLRGIGCALLLPEGAVGFWTDAPSGRYRAMLLELVAHVRDSYPVARASARTAIGGWSMGGYGAIRFAQEHPGLVAAAGSVIGLLDFPNPGYPSERNFPVPALFGATEDWPRHGCLAHVQRLRGLDLSLFAARQAFDHAMNRAFHDALDANEIAHRYEECDGGHDWPTVRTLLPRLAAQLAARIC